MRGLRGWVGQRVIELIEMVTPRLIQHVKQTSPPDLRAVEAWNELLNYLEENPDSLWYGRRLQEGLPISSGLIEGGGKTPWLDG